MRKKRDFKQLREKYYKVLPTVQQLKEEQRIKPLVNAFEKDPVRFFTVATTLRVLYDIGALRKHKTPTKKGKLFVENLINRVGEYIERCEYFYKDTGQYKRTCKEVVRKLQLVCTPQELSEVVQKRDMEVGTKIIEVLYDVLNKLILTYTKCKYKYVGYVFGRAITVFVELAFVAFFFFVILFL